MDYKYDKKAVNQLIDAAMKSWKKAHYIDEPKDGPIFVTRDGKMIWGETTHSSIVDSIGINLFYSTKKIEGLVYLTMWDFFERELGWIRCNSGTTGYEGTTYIAIDKDSKPTEDQYKTLEDIIYYYFTKKKYIEVWIVSNGSNTKEERQNYYKEYTNPEDIIKSIKKYFNTGLLENLTQGQQDANTYLRYSVINDKGNNIGGLFNGIWGLVYSDEDDDSLQRLEDILDELMEAHSAPDTMFDSDVYFAFSTQFVDKYSELFDEIDEILEEHNYCLNEEEINKADVEVVYEDKDQIAFRFKHINEDLTETQEDNIYYRAELYWDNINEGGVVSGSFNNIPTKETVEEYPEDYEENSKEWFDAIYEYDKLMSKLMKGITPVGNSHQKSAFTSSTYYKVKPLLDRMNEVVKKIDSDYSIKVRKIKLDNSIITYKDDNQVLFKESLNESFSQEVDSEGNSLTQEQVEFFKDSKVRDKDGNLLVCYHGAKVPGFKEFNPKIASSQFGKYKFGNANVNYFTTDKKSATSYTNIGVDEGNNVYACYLNITNPYIVDNKSMADIKSSFNIKDDTLRQKQIQLFNKLWHKYGNMHPSEDDLEDINTILHKLNFELRPSSERTDNANYTTEEGNYDLYNLGNNSFFGGEHIVEYAYTLEELFDDDMYDELKESIIGYDEDDYYLSTDDVVRYVLAMNEEDGTDYDGIIIKDIVDSKEMFSNIGTDVITLKSPNQIKLIDNENPTTSNRIDEELNNKDEIIKALKDNFAKTEPPKRCFILEDGTFIDTINGTAPHAATTEWLYKNNLVDKEFATGTVKGYANDISLITKLNALTCNGFFEFFVRLLKTRPTNAQLDSLTKWLDKYYTTNTHEYSLKLDIAKTDDLYNGEVISQRYNSKETDVDSIIQKIKRYYTSGYLAEEFSHLKGNYTYDQIDKELKSLYNWKDTPNKLVGAQLIDKDGKFIESDKYHGNILKDLIGYGIIEIGDGYLDDYNYVSTDLFSKLGYIRCNNDEDYIYIQLPNKLTSAQIKSLEVWLDTFFMGKKDLVEVECPERKQFIRYYLDDSFSDWSKEYSDIYGGTIDDLIKLINNFNRGASLRGKNITEQLDFTKNKSINNENITEQLLLERTRNDLISQSRKGAEYKGDKSKGKNRWERKKYSKVANLVREFNKIDMNTFFKKDILNVIIPVKGETDDYQVKIKFNGVLAEIQKNVKANDNKLEYKTIITALTRTFNSGDVYVWCSCPDFKYRFDYWCSIQNYNSGKPQLIPANITNPDDNLGAACKHINLVISNLFWLMKVASVLNNYIHFAESNMQRQFAEIIFPKVYGMSYPQAYQLGLFDRNYFKHSRGLIDYINEKGRTRGRFKSTQPVEDEKVVVQQNTKQPTFKNVQPSSFKDTTEVNADTSNQPKFSTPKQLSIFDLDKKTEEEKEN